MKARQTEMTRSQKENKAATLAETSTWSEKTKQAFLDKLGEFSEKSLAEWTETLKDFQSR